MLRIWRLLVSFLASEQVMQIIQPHTSELSRLQSLKPALEKICSSSGTAGVSIGVLHGGNVLYKDNLGFRDVAAKAVADSQTLYGIGSMTKAMTAAAIAQLVSDGKLSWTTPLKEIIPGFQPRDPSVANLTTVLDLLAHRTGLSGDISLTFQGDSDALLPADQLLPTINAMKEVYPFRGAWSYNSWGYSLAGLVIEKRSGMPFHQYLQTHIYDPLSMRNTTTQPDFVIGDNVAEPYASLANSKSFTLGKGMEFKNTLFEAAAGAYTNVDDMLKWSAALLDGYQSSTKPSSSQLKELEMIFSAQIQVLSPSYRERSYALGWIRTQLPGVVGVMGDNIDILDDDVQSLPELGRGSPSMLCFYHQGSTVGYYSSVALFPESQSAIVVLANSIALGDSPDIILQAITQALFDFQDPVDFLSYTEKVKNRLIEKYHEMTTTIAQRRRPGTNHHSWNDYTGRYWNELGNFLLEISKDEKSEDGRLLLSFQGSISQVYSLRHLEGDTFEWSLSLDETAKRGRYHRTDAPYFTIDFLSESGKVRNLRWAEYTFVKED